MLKMLMFVLENKIKTAGNAQQDAIFNSTFGSFSRVPSNQKAKGFTESFTGLDGTDNFEFSSSYLEQSGVDANTPTLPVLENQVVHREDQPMPQHLPIIEREQTNLEYTYQYMQPKAKSSCSLRKKSQEHVQNNIFLITDKNFMKIRDFVS